MPLFGNVRAHVNARNSAYPIDLESAMPHRIPPDPISPKKIGETTALRAARLHEKTGKSPPVKKCSPGLSSR
jgi:hypothetical protein